LYATIIIANVTWIDIKCAHDYFIYITLSIQIDDSTSECKALKLSVVDPKCTECTVKGFSMFAGPILSGMITFVSECKYIHTCATCLQPALTKCPKWHDLATCAGSLY